MTNIVLLDYKIFSQKHALYTGQTNGIMGRPRYSTMRHIVNKKNIGFITMRTQVDTEIPNTYLVSKNPIDKNFYGFQTYQFPLYLYTEVNTQQTIENEKERTPNLDLKIVDAIAKKIVLTFTNEKEQTKDTFAPIDILDYIYAVLHSPTYREKYKEFLKIDFPRIPYPKDQATFWQLVKLGKEIREIHLLESNTVDNFITSYLGDGDNVITRKLTKTNIGYEAITDTLGKVWINDTQYFNNVPLVAWEFFIGGYQPAQKWLKDRKDRTLDFEDIFHYQKIIVALTETHRIMQEIDTIEIE